MVSYVVLLLCVFVCFTTTKCISGSRVASLGSSFSYIGAYDHFGPRAGCAVVLLRNLCQGVGCAPAGCFLLFLLVKVFSVCVCEGDCGNHVGASIRVTVCRVLVWPGLPSVFLRVFAVRSLLVVLASARRVLVLWCRLVRCRCLSESDLLRFFSNESSESADSVAVWGSFSLLRSASIKVHVSPSLQTMPSPSSCSVPLKMLPSRVPVQVRLSASTWNSGNNEHMWPCIVTTPLLPASQMPSN